MRRWIQVVIAVAGMTGMTLVALLWHNHPGAIIAILLASLIGLGVIGGRE